MVLLFPLTASSLRGMSDPLYPLWSVRRLPCQECLTEGAVSSHGAEVLSAHGAEVLLLVYLFGERLVMKLHGSLWV